MTFTCPICITDPTSHSFVRLYERNEIVYFYSCPSKATRYNDRIGILYHYSGMLTELNGKSWSWVFDSTGFGFKHWINVQVAIDLAKLISKTQGLKKIYLVHPTRYIRLTLNVVWPFLSSRAKQCISILDD